MAERKKFSELSPLTSITGNEIIPVGYNGDNFKATLNALKEFFGELRVQVFTELVTASVSVEDSGYPSAETGATIDVVYLTSRSMFAARKVVAGGNPSYYAQWNGYDNYMSDGKVRQDIAFVCLTDTYVYVYDGSSLSTRSHGGGGSADTNIITRIETLESTTDNQGYQIGQTKEEVKALQQRATNLEDGLSQETGERTQQMSAINSALGSLNEAMSSITLSTNILGKDLDLERERAKAAEAQIISEAAEANRRIEYTSNEVQTLQDDVKTLQDSDAQSVKSPQVRIIFVLTEDELANLDNPVDGAFYATYESD